MNQVLLYEPVYGARLAPQVTAARAKVIEEGFARRIAAAPDRFRDQTPLPGSKEAICEASTICSAVRPTTSG